MDAAGYPFASRVAQESKELKIPCIVNDGSLRIDELYAKVKSLLDL